MSRYNFADGSTTLSLLASVSAANTAAATSAAGVDLIDYEGKVIITQNHGLGTGTLDGKIQDSADNSSFADVAGLTFTQSAAGPDIKSIVVDPKQIRRYIKYVGTIVTGPHLVGVTVSGMKKTV